MQWKKDLYSRINLETFNKKTLNVLIELPDIRNEIFLSDYEKFGYIPQEVLVTEWNNIISISLGLISVSANRILSISYSFELTFPENGSFSNLIFILNEDKGWDNTIFMDILVEKNFGLKLKNDYLKLNTYSGNFEEKVRACLNEIKTNYIKYANDIISGEKWDRNAWRDLRD